MTYYINLKMKKSPKNYTYCYEINFSYIRIYSVNFLIKTFMEGLMTKF